MSSSLSELKETLTPNLLEEVRELWFEHIEDEDGLMLPGQSDMERWFIRDEAFDKICV